MGLYIYPAVSMQLPPERTVFANQGIAHFVPRRSARLVETVAAWAANR